MKKCAGLFVTGLMTGVLGIVAAPAAAQAPVPDTGSMAAGGTIGISMPSEDSLDTGLDLGLQFERYFTPRVSGRAKLSSAWFDIDGHTFTGTVHPVALEGNIVYNWEQGVWHPYATGGIGWYHFGMEENDLDSSENKFGINFGGGAEYFVTGRDTLLGEIQFRIVPSDADGLLATYKTGYWTLAAGYKRYF